MNIYALFDNFSMSVASIVTGKNKYFSKDLSSKRISELLTLIEIDIPAINGEGYYTAKVLYDGLNEEAAFRVEQWKGANYPTIIYHHGAAEGSYDLSFNKILAQKKHIINANLIGVQAVFNHSNKEFIKSIQYLANYTLLLASSAKLIDEIINQIRQKGKSKVIVSGTSLGGFVTNIHFTYYHSAELYIPLLAGARLGDVFIDSAYSKVTSREIKHNDKKIKAILNFDDDLKSRDQKNIFPLLSKHDQIIKYDIHSQDFLSDHITTIPYGHSTGATKFQLLRDQILKKL